MSSNYLFEVPPPWCAYISSCTPLIQQKIDESVDTNHKDDVVLLLSSRSDECDQSSPILSLRTVVELVVVNNDFFHTIRKSGIMMTKTTDETNNNDNHNNMIQLHPLLASGFFENHSYQLNNNNNNNNHSPPNSECTNDVVGPNNLFSLLQCPSSSSSSLHYEDVTSTLPENYPQCVPIHVRKIVEMKIDNNKIESLMISVTILFTTLWSKKGFTNNNNNVKDDIISEEKIKLALEGRMILQNSVVLLSIVNDSHPSSSDSDFVLIYIQNIEMKIKGQPMKDYYNYYCDDSQYLVLGPDLPYTVDINPTSFQHQLDLLQQQQQQEEQSTIHKTIICPGYETLVNEITTLAYLHQKSKEASPAAVLITGCAGVGKTQLALSVASELCASVRDNMSNRDSIKFRSRVISSKDVILKASTFVDEEELIHFIFPKTEISTKSDTNELLILDDLHELFQLEDDSNELSMVDWERMVSCNAVLSAIDRIIHYNNKYRRHNQNGSCQIFIVGLYQTSSSHSSFFHPKLTRVGRFEKILSMATPTENQRIQILKYFFKEMFDSTINSSDSDRKTIDERNQQRSIALAPILAGCVASDMRRMCTDAFTRSQARAQKNLRIHDNDPSNNIMIRGDVYEQFIWDDLEEAARRVIPSQLALLDVTIASKMNNPLHLNKDKCSPKELFLDCWRQFGGYEETKENIYRTIAAPWRRVFSSFELNDKSPKNWFVPPPSGVIFHGPSGTGKTLAAECLASSLGLNVIKVRASDILDKWLGSSEAAIRSLFARARSAAPCILFFDEIDALASNRESLQNNDASGDVHSRILSTMLNEMDGISSTNATSNGHSIDSTNRILVMAATNRLSTIDSALLRPGRFEEHVPLNLPSAEDIKGILSVKLRSVPLGDNFDSVSIAHSLNNIGATGADIEGICTDSCLDAIHDLKQNDYLSSIESMNLTNKIFDKIIARWKE